MSNLEDRKEQIQQFFNGVHVQGTERVVDFVEPEAEGETIVVELRDDRTHSVSVYLSIPVAPIPQSPRDAVIAEILSQAVSASEVGDLASISLLEANEYEDGTTFVKFHKYGHAEISDTHLSDSTMDRLCAAWIAWRVKQYQPPMSAEEALGDLDDHPF